MTNPFRDAAADISAPLDVSFDISDLSLDVEPPALKKAKRHRRTKAQMAEARRAAEMAALGAEALKAAESVLAAATPGQRYVANRICGKIGDFTPRWSK